MPRFTVTDKLGRREVQIIRTHTAAEGGKMVLGDWLVIEEGQKAVYMNDEQLRERYPQVALVLTGV